jgi:hypothetical protein
MSEAQLQQPDFHKRMEKVAEVLSQLDFTVEEILYQMVRDVGLEEVDNVLEHIASDPDFYPDPWCEECNELDVVERDTRES